jgi:hypothetical protein
MIQCTAQPRRLASVMFPSWHDGTYEILLPDQAFRPQRERALQTDNWLVTETAHAEQMNPEILCALCAATT